jgi:hypothetical protein
MAPLKSQPVVVFLRFYRRATAGGNCAKDKEFENFATPLATTKWQSSYRAHHKVSCFPFCNDVLLACTIGLDKQKPEPRPSLITRQHDT